MKKVCTKCSVCKDVREFHRSKSGKFGRASVCTVCQSAYHREYFLKNTEKINKRTLEYSRINREKRSKYASEYRKKNTTKMEEYFKKYRVENKEKIKERGKKYYNENKAKFSARDRKRSKILRNSTPSWLTEGQWKEMENFYWLAKDLFTVTGEEYHVDHIVPLQGENICGLHVPWNLQVLPSDLNLKKGNRYEISEVCGRGH